MEETTKENYRISLVNVFFSILSVAYISGIFLLADSSVVSDLGTFNPCSLLHLPLYGILTILLILSFTPVKFRQIFPKGRHFWIAGFIALGVGIADEFHQSFIPGREASVTDVFLDAFGILLALVFFLQIYKKFKWIDA